jgi:hypothetical protein
LFLLGQTGDQIKEDEMCENVARMGDTGNVYKMLVGKPERNRPLGRSGCGWEDNIIMHLRVIVREMVEWIYLAQERDRYWGFVNTAMDLRVS